MSEVMSESRDVSHVMHLDNRTNGGAAWCQVISNMNNNPGQIKTIPSPDAYCSCYRV
jgi:hypothetical protein